MRVALHRILGRALPKSKGQTGVMDKFRDIVGRTFPLSLRLGGKGLPGVVPRASRVM